MTKEQGARVGNWIKEERAERNITRANLARAINVYPDTLRKWENGEIPYGYIYHGLRYFFDKPVKEIPENGQPQLATGAWLKWWIETVDVRVSELAEKIEVTKACVYRWMKPDTEIPLLAEYAIRQAMRDLGF